MKKPLAGFTIVELVVVIAVVGILAAVTVVSYRGVQSEANDTAIKTAAQQMADAIQLWSTRTNKAPGVELYRTTDPAVTRTNGFVQGEVYYGQNPEKTLTNAGYLPPNFSQGLSSSNSLSSNPERILMFYECSGGRYAIYASLNDNSGKEAARTTATNAGCANIAYAWDTAGMNYIIIF